MLQFSPRRVVALALMICWLAPWVGALATAVHARTGHHHGDELAMALAMGVVHGHTHGVAEPAHDHPAARPESLPALAGLGTVAASATMVAAASPPASPATPAIPPSRPPPEPLFYAHCALLL